jgi:Phenylalanyl-tRNA synthetase alpha subunit
VQVPSLLNQQTVAQALSESLSELARVKNAAELRAVKGQLVGENSPISKLNALIKDLPADQKAEAGKLVGGAKAELMAAFEVKAAELDAVESVLALQAEAVDLTAAPRVLRRGARHPLSLLMDQVSEVFVGMGLGK